MSLYDYWVTPEGKFFKISEMETYYIRNCINEINLAGSSFRHCTFEELTANELKKYSKPTQKAWYVLHADEYRSAFEYELLSRVKTDDSN